jgi:hypothetical protein
VKASDESGSKGVEPGSWRRENQKGLETSESLEGDGNQIKANR